MTTKEQVRQLFTDSLKNISQMSANDNLFQSIFKSLQNQKFQKTCNSDNIETLSDGSGKMLIRVAFAYSIDEQGLNELNRLTRAITDLVEGIRSIAPQKDALEFYISFQDSADGSTGPRDTCLARGIYLHGS